MNDYLVAEEATLNLSTVDNILKIFRLWCGDFFWNFNRFIFGISDDFISSYIRSYGNWKKINYRDKKIIK